MGIQQLVEIKLISILLWPVVGFPRLTATHLTWFRTVRNVAVLPHRPADVMSRSSPSTSIPDNLDTHAQTLLESQNPRNSPKFKILTTPNDFEMPKSRKPSERRSNLSNCAGTAVLFYGRSFDRTEVMDRIAVHCSRHPPPYIPDLRSRSQQPCWSSKLVPQRILLSRISTTLRN